LAHGHKDWPQGAPKGGRDRQRSKRAGAALLDETRSRLLPNLSMRIRAASICQHTWSRSTSMLGEGPVRGLHEMTSSTLSHRNHLSTSQSVLQVHTICPPPRAANAAGSTATACLIETSAALQICLARRYFGTRLQYDPDRSNEDMIRELRRLHPAARVGVGAGPPAHRGPFHARGSMWSAKVRSAAIGYAVDNAALLCIELTSATSRHHSRKTVARGLVTSYSPSDRWGAALRLQPARTRLNLRRNP